MASIQKASIFHRYCLKDAVFFHQSFTQARVNAMGQAPHKSNEQNTVYTLGLKMLDAVLSQTNMKEATAQYFKSSKFFQT